MTKRIVSGLMALLMCLVMSITAPAAMASESQATPGRWEANAFLVILYLREPVLFDLFIASGAHVYNCVARGENGNVIGEGVCADPMPTFPW